MAHSSPPTPPLSPQPPLSVNLEQACSDLQKELEALSNNEVFAYLVEIGKSLPVLLPEHRTPEYLIKGCVSQAWLIPRRHDDRIYFFLDSEALIVKGILSFISRVYNGRTRDEVLSVTPEFWKKTGITQILSMNRRNGLAHILKQIQIYALSFDYIPKLDASTTDFHSSPLISPRA